MKILTGLALLALLVLVLIPVASATPGPDPNPDPNPEPNPPPNTGSLADFLLWVIGGGGAGVIAYWLMEHIGLLGGLSSEWKRYVSLGLAAVLACLAFVAAVALSYKDDPGSAQGWLEALFAVAFLAVTAGQVLHGRLKLRPI